VVLGRAMVRRPCSSLRPSSTSARASTVSGMAVHPSDSRDENIRTVVDLERAALAGRSRAERLGDVITRLLGSTIFLIIHLVWFGLWVLAGWNLVPGLPAFDHSRSRF
jgi:uncharacterized membrane protein